MGEALDSERVTMRSATRNRVGRDPSYLEFIAALPCLLCFRMNGKWQQKSRTEVAHIGERGLSQKCGDIETAPLCGECHRTGRWSHHNLGRRFWEFHGLDRETVIAELQKRYQEQQ